VKNHDITMQQVSEPVMTVYELLARKYQNLEKIGAGAMGEIWRGVDKHLERLVAIKVMRAELAMDQSSLSRFKTEAKALAQISHPNIVAVYELVEEQGHQWMVLEYVSGENLEQVLLREGAMSWQKAAELAQQALLGLEQAHAAGIVHRDIKPANAIFSDKGILKLADFGIVRTAGGEKLTRLGHSVGTPAYMSPEQCKGIEADARTDIYSLGIMLYEMISGRLPFDGTTDYEMFRQHVECDPPRLENLKILPRLEEIILKSIRKAPEQRFQSAKEFRLCIEALLSSSTVVLPPPRSVSGKKTVVAAFCVLIGSGVALTLVMRDEPSREVPVPAPETVPTQQITTAPKSDVPAAPAPASIPADISAKADAPGSLDLARCMEAAAQASHSFATGNVMEAKSKVSRAVDQFGGCSDATELLAMISKHEKKTPLPRAKPVPRVAQAPTPSCERLVNEGRAALRTQDGARIAISKGGDALRIDANCPGAKALITEAKRKVDVIFN